jgi:hypothetical protein
VKDRRSNSIGPEQCTLPRASVPPFASLFQSVPINFELRSSTTTLGSGTNNLDSLPP